MGFLKKLTKPISKFLDKIVPNEIKPALPYLSAFAPFMLGPGAAAGSWWQKALYNPALRAGIMGGTNIASQLAQEGSEGEFSGLSALLAAGTGAGTAGGAPEMFRGWQTDTMNPQEIAARYGDAGRPTGILSSAKNLIGKGGETASKFLLESGDILGQGGKKPGFDMATLEAASIPVTQGTADLAMADARRALRDYENEMAGAPDAITGGVTDEGRRRAIRAALEAGGHAEETILDALASLGLDLRGGGIVGLKHGGRIGYQWGGGNWGPGGKSPSKSSGTKGGYQNVHQTGAITQTPGRTRTGIGGIGGGITTPKTKTKTIKTKTDITPTTSWADKFKGWFGVGDPADDDTSTAESLANTVRNYEAYNTKAQLASDIAADFAAKELGITQAHGGIVGLKHGGRIGLLRGGDPNDYPQQEDVSVFELQQGEGVPIGPMVKNEFESDMLSALKQAYDEAVKKGYKGSFKQFIQEQGSGIRAAEGGMMSVLPKGKEMDYRGGGVIPVGSRERADDVPARLSKNEFVMTADAVRAAGGGSVNRGAKKMYNLMHNLEARV
jgi:hypothetical protein